MPTPDPDRDEAVALLLEIKGKLRTQSLQLRKALAADPALRAAMRTWLDSAKTLYDADYARIIRAFTG